MNPSKAGEFLNLFKRSDAFRRPERFAALLAAARIAQPAFDPTTIGRALQAAAAVDAGAMARGAAMPAGIPALLDKAREQAIAAALS